MLHSTFKRKPRKRVVSRSFRVPPDVDKQLDAEAKKRGWTKSFLIRDIIVSWIRYQRAESKVTGVGE
jgi:predicted transcriptional regulator